jgi:S1-C subfamily serine protease
MVAVIVLTSFVGGAIAGSIAGRIYERSHGSQCNGKAYWLLGATLEERGREVYLASVYAGGPAGSAGLADGDRLLSIDNTTISSVSQATEILCSHSAGDQISLIAEHNHVVDQHFMTLGLATDTGCLTIAPVTPIVPPPPPNTNSNQHEEAHLGVVYRMLAPGDPSGLDRGAMLITIWPGGAAEMAELEPGDIILEVDSTSLTQSYTLEMALERFSAGQAVNLLVRGAVDGQNRTIRVTLGG